MKTIFFLLALLAVSSGCRPSVTEREARERNQPLFQQAITAEHEGNLDLALKLYGDTLMANPTAASAHFHLAILLQEHAHDYLAAVYHYGRYLELQPGSEKEELAQERVTAAEQRLTHQLVRKHGETVGALQANLFAELEEVRAKGARLETENAALTRENTGLQAKLKASEGEVERLKNLYNNLLKSTPSPTQPPRRVEVPALDTTKPPPKPAIPTLAIPPTLPAKHTVQAGETLYRISEKYYNTPTKWTVVRDANLEILGAEGNLRAGQVLTIPLAQP